MRARNNKKGTIELLPWRKTVSSRTLPSFIFYFMFSSTYSHAVTDFGGCDYALVSTHGRCALPSIAHIRTLGNASRVDAVMMMMVAALHGSLYHAVLRTLNTHWFFFSPHRQSVRRSTATTTSTRETSASFPSRYAPPSSVNRDQCLLCSRCLRLFFLLFFLKCRVVCIYIYICNLTKYQ